MLDRIITAIVTILVISMLLFGGMFTWVAAVKWWQLAAEANVLATIMSHYGEYDTEAEQHLTNFCTNTNIDADDITVTATPGSGETPAAYGQDVSVKLEYNYDIQLFTFGGHDYVIPFNMPATGRTISTYTPGLNTG